MFLAVNFDGMTRSESEGPSGGRQSHGKKVPAPTCLLNPFSFLAATASPNYHFSVQT